MQNYSGNKDPFIYVAYDEKDRTEALKIIEQLGKKNKIYASSSLEEKEKKNMKKESLAVIILSEKSMPDMEKQVTCAADLKKESRQFEHRYQKKYANNDCPHIFILRNCHSFVTGIL